MIVFLLTTGITFLLLCVLFVFHNAVRKSWEPIIQPDWKTLTLSSVFGLAGYGVSLLL